VIPAGTPVGAKINLILSFPQCLPSLAWYPWKIETWEDGQLIEELSAGLNYSSSSSGGSSTALPTVLMIKEAINRAYESSLAEGLLFERREFHATFALDDQKEGMRAFVEKREPEFKGR
jgi:hypothetical protein